MPITKSIVLPDAEGDDEVIELPAKWCICQDCEGAGASSAHLGSFTQSELDDREPGFYHDYMTGKFDRECESCEGTGKTLEIDRDRADAAVMERYDRELAYERQLQAEERAEQRYFGMGG